MNLAHLKPDGEGHALVDHLLLTAALASRFAENIRGGEVARLLGLWHDLGKFRPAFQKRLSVSVLQPDKTAAPAPHAPVGAFLALQRNRPDLATIIHGHHGGLKNPVDINNILGSDENLWTGFQKESNELFEHVFTRHPELKGDDIAKETSPPIPPGLSKKDKKRAIELWVRLLFSCLVDADFLDTEAFYDAKASEARSRFQTIAELDAKLTSHMQSFASCSQTPVNILRGDILRSCIEKAELSPGLFSLTVPTGGGKTLASLAFALRHALVHGLERIIVVIPYTSIIEQTAKVYSDIFGSDQVIEHHSLSLAEKEENHTTLIRKLAAQNWDAPIVVTTTVQFFESLFANRPGKCRKLHNIARSVVVLDEAQTLPEDLLKPILDVVRRLCDTYGTSLVFSTATQPAFSSMDDPELKLENMRELAPDPQRLFQQLSRVRTHWPEDLKNSVSWPELAERLAKHDRVLAIVHRRKDAVDLIREMDGVLGHGDTIHLSASMCPAHRLNVIDEIKKRLKNEGPLRVVSTQLVEAGVDIDFPVVYRALAGLDSLAQSAGRCNREGLLDRGDFHVFMSSTEPPMGVLVRALGQTRSMLIPCGTDGLDLQNPDFFREYFDRLYRSGPTDSKRIQELRERFDYPEVASRFKIIDEHHSANIVVPYGKSTSLIEALPKADPQKQKDLIRRLQRYSVGIPKNLFKHWLDAGILEPTCDIFWQIPPDRMDLYCKRLGVILIENLPFPKGNGALVG